MKYFFIVSIAFTSILFLSACTSKKSIIEDGVYTQLECKQIGGITSSEFTGIMSQECLISGDCHFKYLCPNGTTSIGTVGSGLEGGVCCK